MTRTIVLVLLVLCAPASAATLVPQEAHASKILVSRWSPNGKFLATGSFDHTVRIWDAQGRLWLVLAGHVEAVRSLAWHPNGRMLASASRRANVLLWDLATGSVKHRLHGAGWDVAFEPKTGARIVTVGPSPNNDKAIRLWQTSSGRMLAEHATTAPGIRQLLGVDWSPTGDRVVAATNGGPYAIFDTRSWSHTVTKSHSPTWRVQFAPDGKTFAAAKKASLVFFDASSGDIKRTLSIPGADYPTFAISADGKTAAKVGNGAVVVVVSLPLGNKVHSHRFSRGYVESVALRPNTTEVFVGGGGGVRMAMLDYRSRGAPKVFPVENSLPANGIDVSDNFIATTGSTHAAVWDRNFKVIAGVTTSVGSAMGTVRISPSERYVAVSGNNKKVWILDLKRPHSKPLTHRFKKGEYVNIAWGPRDRLFMLCDRKLVRWDVARRRTKKTTLVDQLPVTDLLVQGGTLVVGRWRQGLIIDVQSLRVRHTIAPAKNNWGGGSVETVAAHPQWLAFAGSAGVVIWDVQAKRVHHTIAGRQPFAPPRFSPDGTKLAFFHRAKEMRVFDIASKRHTVLGAQTTARDLWWVDDRSLAVTSDAGRLVVYDGQRKRALTTPHQNRVWMVRRLPRRKAVVTASNYVWVTQTSGQSPAISLRTYLDGRRLVGAAVTTRGHWIGGDPITQSYFRTRSGPGIVGTQLSPTVAKHKAPAWW